MIICEQRSADLRFAIPDQRGSAMALTGIALAEAGQGIVVAARGLAGEAARLLDRSGDRPGLSGALNNLAAIEVISVGPTVLGGVIFYPADQAAQAISGWREATADAPEELTSMINLTAAPPLPFLPESVHGSRVAVVIVCYARDLHKGEAAVAGLRRLGDPIADVLAPMPYLALQQLVDPLWEAGAANYFTSVFLDGVPDLAVDTLVEAHGRSAVPPATCELHVHHLGGAMYRIDKDDTAFPYRRSPFLFNCIVRSQHPAELPPLVERALRTREGMSRFGGGLYVNFSGEGGAERAANPPQTYTRLAEVKHMYDPDNVFRFNQNISPAPEY
ncbi:MAG TPA: BBE domain-containing protein [Propionibacteriaceae bacterium]